MWWIIGIYLLEQNLLTLCNNEDLNMLYENYNKNDESFCIFEDRPTIRAKLNFAYIVYGKTFFCDLKEIYEIEF